MDKDWRQLSKKSTGGCLPTALRRLLSSPVKTSGSLKVVVDVLLNKTSGSLKVVVDVLLNNIRGLRELFLYKKKFWRKIIKILSNFNLSSLTS